MYMYCISGQYCVGEILVTVFLVQYMICSILFFSFGSNKVGFNVFVEVICFCPFCLVIPNVVVLYIKSNSVIVTLPT